MLVKKIPTLRQIDGREVTPEERDHVELLFAPSEVVTGVNTTYVTAPQPGEPRLGTGKVPIKLTSMNFESLIVPQYVPQQVSREWGPVRACGICSLAQGKSIRLAGPWDARQGCFNLGPPVLSVH